MFIKLTETATNKTIAILKLYLPKGGYNVTKTVFKKQYLI